AHATVAQLQREREMRELAGTGAVVVAASGALQRGVDAAALVAREQHLASKLCAAEVYVADAASIEAHAALVELHALHAEARDGAALEPEREADAEPCLLSLELDRVDEGARNARGQALCLESAQQLAGLSSSSLDLVRQAAGQLAQEDPIVSGA